MKNSTVLLLLTAGLAAAAPVLAQPSAVVEDRGSGAVVQGQQRAGIAYRELQQAGHDAKFAEQEVWQAQEAHAQAQKALQARRQELAAAEKALARARARQQSAQQAYDAAVNAVDAAHRKAPPQKP